MRIRRLWFLHVDDRSKEIGFTIGSKVYRARHEAGKFGGYLHYDFAVPYNEGRPLPGWRVGLPQSLNGIPRDGKLLRIDTPTDGPVYVDFFLENLGIPGSLICELFANLEVIPQEELYDAQVQPAHQADVSQAGHTNRRGSKALGRVRSEEDQFGRRNAG